MASKYNRSIPQCLPDAVFILETPSSPLDARLNALRFIQSFVESEKISSMVDRMKINQLVLDSIMSLLNREDLIPDLRKRQLVRTECFIMLAKILESKSLFAGAKPSDDDTVQYGQTVIPAARSALIESKDDSSLGHTSVNGGMEEGKGDKHGGTAEENDGDDDYTAASGSSSIQTMNTQSSRVTKTTKFSGTTKEGGSMASVGRSLLSRTAPLMTTSSMSQLPTTNGHDSVLGSALSRTDRRAVPRHMKPRQSVLSGPTMHAEKLVPGVDPYNIIQVDKRLGYQKSRVWVPFAGPGRLDGVPYAFSKGVITSCCVMLCCDDRNDPYSGSEASASRSPANAE
jgi:hypothetical protein